MRLEGRQPSPCWRLASVPMKPSSQIIGDQLRQRKKRTRISHPKSRGGCLACKKRKVKCDEQRPSCYTCTRLRETCLYLPWPAKKGSKLGEKPPGPIVQVDPPHFGVGLNLADLELLHVYLTSTYATLSLSPTLRNFWRITVPRVSFQNGYVTREILALTALHLGYHRPDRRAHYMSVALNHHQTALQEAMRLLKDVTKGSTTGLLVFSVLAILIALAFPKGSCSGDIPTEKGSYEDWMILIKGTKRLHDALGEDLSNHPLSPLLRFGATKLSFKYRSSAVFRIWDEAILHTLQYHINDSHEDPALISPYQEAINNLRFVAGCSLDCEGIDAFVWIYRCADSLVPFLECPTQEALVTLAYFCTMLKRLETQWWLKGWATRMMSDLYVRMDEKHRTWMYGAFEEMGFVTSSD